jgi:hypothetical protein
MKKIGLVVLLASSLFALEHKSNIDFKYFNYANNIDEKLIGGETRLKSDYKDIEFNSTFQYMYSSDYTDRRFFDVNELYAKIKDFTFGKQIKYFGELEGFNIADTFNTKNYLVDAFDKDSKIGSCGLWNSFYLEDSILELGIKLYEEKQKFPSQDFTNSSLPLPYSGDLKLQNSRYSPSLYVVYGFDMQEFANKLIFMHGYDNKRYFVQNGLSLSQYAYKVNKLSFTSNTIYNDTLFKFEGSVTDVLSDDNMSDYAQLGMGIEKTYNLPSDLDMDVYGEYYRYIYKDKKIENVDISEIYDNDVFIAVKLNFNDTAMTEIKSGILYDTKNHEKTFKAELKHKLTDDVVLSGEFLKLKPSNDYRSMVCLQYLF